MFKLLNLLLLLTVCGGKIQINIITSNYLNKTIVKCRGADIKQVNDEEIRLFNITNENLNRGIRVEMGKVPDEVFLKDPTAYGDVFKKFKWPDVKRKLSVRKTTIVEFFKTDVVLKRIEHINNTTMTIKTKTDVVQPVTNTATAIWNKEGLPEDLIYYKVFVDFGYGRVLHQAEWRDANATMFDMLIEKTKGVIDMAPGQRIVKKLLAEKIILLIEVELDAHLIGNIVANYAQLYGKYHFWSPTIGNIMRAAKLKNEITTKFLLEIRFYGNPRLEIIDTETNKEIAVEEKRHQNKRKQKYSFSKS